MTRPEPAPRVRVPHGDLQGFGTCTALVLEGYFLLLLADPRNAPFFGILFLAGAWRLVQARRGAQPPLDWSRTHVRVAVPIAALGLGFGSAAALAPGLVHFFGAVVVWLEAVLLLSRGRESMLLRALACLSLVHVVLAAFVARPAATVPLLFVYLFLVVRTLGIADRRVGEVPEQPRFLALDARAFAAVSAVALALFLLLPRPVLPASWFGRESGGDGGPKGKAPRETGGDAGGIARIGFSEGMAFDAALRELIADKRVAMRVGEFALVGTARSLRDVLPHLRLRGLWFNEYRDGGWHRRAGRHTLDDKDDGAADGVVRLPDGRFGVDPTLPPVARSGAAHLSWSARVNLEALGTSCVFVAPGTRAIAQGWLYGDGEEGYFFPLPPSRTVSYRFTAILQENQAVAAARVRRTADDRVWLSVPGDAGPLRRLAEELTAGRTRELDRILAVRDHLRDGGRYAYSLIAPALPEGADPVGHFLFQDQTGFCVHFATSMALLLRAAGIPCRMAGGYLTDEFDGPTQEFIVRQSHAHAWVEVPFEGLGWVPFDPTPLPDRLVEAPLGDTTRAATAAPSHWGNFVWRLEQFDQSRFRGDVGEGIAGLIDAALGGRGQGEAVTVWAGLLAAGLAGAAALWWMGRRGPAAAAHREGGTRAAPPLPSVPFYRELLRLTARRGLVRVPNETPAEFARRVDGASGEGLAERIVGAYYAIAFGRRTLDPTENAVVRDALAGLERTLRAGR